ncbi:MAG: site-specific integrase [Pseudomonadota bacterium]
MSLKPDNSHLSRLTNNAFQGFRTAQFEDDGDRHDGAGLSLPHSVRDFVRDSVAANTRRAYASDLAHFLNWGGSLPSKPQQIAEYLASLAETHKPSTIGRRLASLSKAHASATETNPCKHELVRATMKGIRRRLGLNQRQARPLLRDDLFAILDRMTERPKDIRDRALLLLGFATAMRRSELVALEVEDIERVERGLLVNVRRSKTDQGGRGRQIAVPFGRTQHCPVKALDNWLAFSPLSFGPVFRRINRHGQVLSDPITGEAVSLILRSRLNGAGYHPAGFSGHSLRAGFATSAANANAPTHKIRQTTGHRSDISLSRYIRGTDLFQNSAAYWIL